MANVCTFSGQQSFTRAYLNEAYLWYREVPQVNPANFTTIPGYFDALLTPLLDSTGARKDRFSFVITNAQADTSASGVGASYGAEFIVDSADRIRVAEVEANSPAANAGLARGGEVVRGYTGTLFPSQAGVSITISYKTTPTATARNVTMVSAIVQNDPVPQTKAFQTTSGKKLGYVLFNAHSRGAQDKLIAAVLGLQPLGLDSIVLDMRYNGGGFIYTAQSLASMLTSATNDGKVFERLQFNDKRAQETADSTFSFTRSLEFGETTYPRGYVLPRLALPKVYVLTTGDSCSATESVINGLRGVDVQVVLIGSTTCGKPYGFARQDNCGLSYYPIEFQGTNAKGFGEYPAGFTATCNVGDDLTKPLGDPTESMLAAALSHAETGTCPPAGTAREQAKSQSLLNAERAAIGKPLKPGKVMGQ